MWMQVGNQNDVDTFLKEFDYFHDGVIKEVKVETGSYVLQNLAMAMINQPVAYVYIQRQVADKSTVELKLTNAFMISMHSDLNSSLEIHEASILLKEGDIYFSKEGFFENEPVGGTWFGAKKLEWHLVENGLGEEPRYAITDYEYEDE